MKNFLYLLVLLFSFNSCQSQTPQVDVNALQLDFKKWWAYHYQNIMLSKDFVAINVNGATITKEEFLRELIEGKTIPIELKIDDAKTYYQLFTINPNADASISAVITESAFNEYSYFKMEGKPFPTFSFEDLNGNVINNESLKGKITVIKCWYIHCTACVKEFPQVNNLVEKYKNREDIFFLSLTEDTPQELQKFLIKKPLSYKVVPNMKKYMNEVLQLNAFPTHFILDKEGKIVKVLSNFESLEYALHNIVGSQ